MKASPRQNIQTVPPRSTVIQIEPYLQRLASRYDEAWETEKLDPKKPIDPAVKRLIRQLYKGWPPTERAILSRKTILFPNAAA